MSMLAIRHDHVHRGARQVLEPGVIEAALPAAVAVVGINGSGKSSLFMHLTDTLNARRHRARITVGARPVRIGYAPQSPALPPWLTPAQTAALYGVDFTVLLERMPRLHLDELRGQRNAALSLGQQQVLTIALALGVDASLLILDEPFAALDFRRRIGVIELLHEWKSGTTDRALLLSSQSAAELIELCEHFVVIREGRYVFNGPRSALTDVSADPLRSAEQKLLQLLT